MSIYVQKIVFGFLFGVGFCFALLIADKVRFELNERAIAEIRKAENAENQKILDERTLDATKVLVTQTRLVKTKQSTVVIRVENKLDTAFSNARVLIKFFDESGLFSECSGFLENFRAGETRDRVITCYELTPTSLPENIRLEAEVKNVQKY